MLAIPQPAPKDYQISLSQLSVLQIKKRKSWDIKGDSNNAQSISQENWEEIGPLQEELPRKI